MAKTPERRLKPPRSPKADGLWTCQEIWRIRALMGKKELFLRCNSALPGSTYLRARLSGTSRPSKLRPPSYLKEKAGTIKILGSVSTQVAQHLPGVWHSSLRRPVTVSSLALMLTRQHSFPGTALIGLYSDPDCTVLSDSLLGLLFFPDDGPGSTALGGDDYNSCSIIIVLVFMMSNNGDSSARGPADGNNDNNNNKSDDNGDRGDGNNNNVPSSQRTDTFSV
uniref:Uncharacterized protein n=1 Tax=Oryza brachyantha TaxID=4533 RepID=J3KZL2_ORYBR